MANLNFAFAVQPVRSTNSGEIVWRVLADMKSGLRLNPAKNIRREGQGYVQSPDFDPAEASGAKTLISSNAGSAGTVRAVTFDLLRKLQISVIFGNPGSTELPMFRDFPDDFRYVLGLQESVAVGMADGYAQATNNIALVNLHSAAGVGHALGAIFTAFRNQTPLLITAGQQARSILPFDPFLAAVSATEFPKPYVKYAVEPARAEDVPLAIARAYHIAMQEPRGPVFVSIPVDDWNRQTEFVVERSVVSARYPDPHAIAAIATALESASNPALIVGAAVDRGGGWDAMEALAERVSCKVYAAPYANRCGFSEEHPLYSGSLPPSRQGIVKSLAGHDFLLVLGSAAFPYHTEEDGPHVPEGSTLFQITENPEFASWTPSGSTLVADLKPSIEAITQRLERRDKGPLAPRAPLPLLEPGDRISVDFLMQTLASVRDPASVLVEEIPTSSQARRKYIRVDRPASYLCGASGGLGFGMAAAVGHSVGAPDRPVLAIVGDGSAMYTIQSLYSATRENADVTYVIVNNQSYLALEEFGKHFAMTEVVGTKLPGLDFAGMAASMGLASERIERPDRLAAALREAIGSKGPALIEVMVGE